jgi:hypothetical protein
VSRYFAGYVGVDEEPVTGSAHCCLFPYWSAVLGKDVLRARQVSKRGGELRSRCRSGLCSVRLPYTTVADDVGIVGNRSSRHLQNDFSGGAARFDQSVSLGRL